MARLDDIIQTMEDTKDGCDHNCLKCDMYLPNYDMCFHEAEKQRMEWNRKEHERFGRVLKGEE